MKLLPVSDLHLERRKLEDIAPLDDAFDVLVCAGDIWEGEPEKSVQAIVELAKGKLAIIVPGNHDFYTRHFDDHRTVADHMRLLEEEADRQNARSRSEDLVTVLTPSAPVHEFDDVIFIGLTLWTDWTQSSRWADSVPGLCNESFEALSRREASHWKEGPREYRAIRTEAGPWTPYDAVAEHARHKAILFDHLAPFGPDVDKTVVITHHCPLAQCADVYRALGARWWTPAFYGSDLLPNMPEALRPDVWIFGHVHAPFDEWHGRTRAVCNPVEGGTFNPALIIDV